MFPKWEKLSNKQKAKALCLICVDENNDAIVMGIDGLTAEKMAEVLESAARTIRNIPVKKER